MKICSLGLEGDPNSTDDSPARYSYVDGFVDTSFFELAREFPWGEEEPDLVGPDGNPAGCVRWVKDFNGGGVSFQNEWADASCGDRREFLCRRACSRKDNTEWLSLQAFIISAATVLVLLVIVGVILVRKVQHYQNQRFWIQTAPVSRFQNF